MSDVARIAKEVERQSREVADYADIFLDERDERRLNRIREDAGKFTIDVVEVLNPDINELDIFASVYLAMMALEAKSAYGERLTRDAEDAVDDVEKLQAELKRESRGSRRSGRNSRDRDDDRGSRRSGRSSRRSGRSERSERSSRRGRDDRDDDRSSKRSSRGFGKGRRTEQDDHHEERSHKGGEFKGKSTAYDPRRFKLAKGVIVENYEEHELKLEHFPSYNKPELEKKRAMFIDKGQEALTKELETFNSVESFINCTADDNLEVGLVAQVTECRLTPEIKDAYLASQGGDLIQTAMRLLVELDKSTEATAVRLRRILNRRANMALHLTANLFITNKKITFDEDTVKEWEETQVLLENEELFEKGCSPEFHKVFEGLIASLMGVELNEEINRVIVTSTMFAGKANGTFCTHYEVAGDDKLLRINDEHHPELYSVATAITEIRDGALGDAWSEGGIVPVVVCDSYGGNHMVIAEKASAVKYIVNGTVTFK